MTDEKTTQHSRDTLLARRFVALADTLVDDYDVVDLLDRLVTDCIELLDVTAAGILLSDQRGNLQLMASSSEETRVLELFQLEGREGPCLDAIRTSSQVAVTDEAEMSDRWPGFAVAARAAGYTSVHAFPMRLREETIGALNLFGSQSSSIADDDQEIAQALADVATIGILQQRTLHRASLVAEQLQVALNTRIVVEQAKGVLAEYAGVDMPMAFTALRSYARGSNQKIGTVADALVRRNLEPGVVLPSER
jgi:transcriptional regulator with GAF, ATPase, and Fis domain